MTEPQFSYIPVRDKKPLIDWKEYQTRFASSIEIDTWRKQFENSTLGIVTGSISNILVLDIDGDVGKQSVQNIAGGLPATWVSKTIKGWHYYFKWNDQLKLYPTTKVGILPHVDIRGEGGYVVKYEWCKGHSPLDLELADIPQWLLDLITYQEIEQKETNKAGWILETISNLKKGNRHYSFSKLVGKLNRDGWSKEDIFAVLKPHAESCDFDIKNLWDEILRMSNRYSDQSKSNELKGIEASKLLAESNDTFEWLVDGIIPKEGISIIAGAPGYGKSWLLLDLAIDLSTGSKWLGKFITCPSKVMYIDEESSKNLLRYRLRKLLNFKELKSDLLRINFYIGEGLSFSNPKSLENLKYNIQISNSSIVIVDSLIRVHSAEENNATAMAEMFSKVKQIVREFNCTIIFADHTRKQGFIESSVDQQLRGTSEKMAAIDSSLVLNRIGNNLLIDHAKSRFSEPIKSFEVGIVDIDSTKTQVRYIG